MEAYKRMIISEILLKDNQQFIVPIYQREYKWTEAECARIVKDIISSGKSGKEHFVGSIVYQLTNLNFSDRKLYLVDGQQRITTMMLITKALNLLVSNMEGDDARYVRSKTEKILLIDSDDRNKGYTVYPSENDRLAFNIIVTSDSYSSIVNNSVIPQECRMLNNFKTAYNMLKEAIDAGEDIRNTIYQGFLNLSVVEIIVEKNENAQIIFESINSLGVKLTNAELIQNYLLMSNDRQEELYNNKWKPLRNQLIGESNMEQFVKYYLHMKLGYQINDEDIYKEYIKYAELFRKDDVIDKAEMINDLYDVAEIYSPFLKHDSSYSTTTNALMQELRDMYQSTVHPFLMRVFLDHKNGRIDENTLNKTINLIIVYIVRRLICKAPSNSLRSFTLNLYNRIFKVSENYNRYYESIYAFLQNVKTNDRLRSLEETLEELSTFQLYGNSKLATYLLYRIENGRYPHISSEIVSADSITVEHIMPQTLTDEWIMMLGEDNAEDIHLKYVNTLGNLSLSSRSKNSSMSNETFEVKKKILQAETSKFAVLNQGIDELEKFGEEEIIDRENRLAGIFAKKYDLEAVNTEGIKFEDNIEVICNGEMNPIYQGSVILAYKLKNRETAIDSFGRMVVTVTKQLYEEYPDKIRELAAMHFNPWNEDENSIDCIHYSYGDNDKDPVVADNIRVHNNYSAKYCVQFCEAVMSECGLEPEELSVFLKTDTIRGDSGVSKQMRVNKIRQALQELSDEGTIEYDYEGMPKSFKNIKSQVQKLTDAIGYKGPDLVWDNGYYPSAYYLEYSTTNHELDIVVRCGIHTKYLCNALIEHESELGINIENTNQTWWHIKRYPFDYKKIYDSEDDIEEFKSQMREKLIDVQEFAEKLNVFIRSKN